LECGTVIAKASRPFDFRQLLPCLIGFRRQSRTNGDPIGRPLGQPPNHKAGPRAHGAPYVRLPQGLSANPLAGRLDRGLSLVVLGVNVDGDRQLTEVVLNQRFDVVPLQSANPGGQTREGQAVHVFGLNQTLQFA
jgi:hypothetical protein